MLSAEYQARIDAAKTRAHGRWGEILAAAGVDNRIRLRKILPCPVCHKGKDCFQYTDKFGEGNYHCRKCGPGGGFKLLQALRDWSFHEALCFVEDYLGTKPPESSDAAKALRLAQRKQAFMRRLIDRLWNESFPVKTGDPVDQYLRGRGLGLPRQSLALRCHPALEYFESSESQEGSRPRRVARYPAKLAQVINPRGDFVGLHRTYLHQGKKLDAADAKKVLMLPSLPGQGGESANAGCAVRLSEATDELATCEGIETGIAISLGHNKPVWPALNAGNLEKLWIPDSVRRLCIYSDNDADSEFAGQASAYALARRVLRERSRRGPLQVHVFVPKRAGEDWADVWQRRQATNLPRAA
jgi:putative DNA primase/helicase